MDRDQPRFIVDMNIGKLAPWLRALGYDTLFINPIDDATLVETARREGRVVLTRDRGIFRRRLIASGAVRALAVEGDNWRAQLAQVIAAYGLAAEPTPLRCMACNGALQPVTREAARPNVPAYVYRTAASFLHCPECARYYWPGTHWGRIKGEIEAARRGPNSPTGDHDGAE